MQNELKMPDMKRRKFVHYTSLSLLFSGLAETAEGSPRNAHTPVDTPPPASKLGYLDLPTARLEAREAVEHEYGLGVLLLDDYDSASLEALEYLASLELFVLHVNFASLTAEMVAALSRVRAETLSIGERMNLELLSAYARFDPVNQTELDISSVKTLSATAAARLVASGAADLSFWAFDEMAVEAAEELARHAGGLRFRADQASQIEVARALSRFSGRRYELVTNLKPSKGVLRAFKRNPDMHCYLETGLSVDAEDQWTLHLEQMAAYRQRQRLRL